MPVAELIKRWAAGIEQGPGWALFGGLSVLVVASLGTAAVQVFGGEQQVAAGRSVGVFASATPAPAAVANAAPRASSTPVRNGADLGKVCAGWYTGDTTVSDGRLYRLLDKYVVSQSTVSRR